MYNRYIPQQPFEPVEEPSQHHRSSPLGDLLGRLASFGGSCGENTDSPGRNKGLGDKLRSLLPDSWDTGDVLLILILVYLFLESDDEEWLIILGLIILMGLKLPHQE